MDANDAEHLTGGLVESHESHRARVVKLRQSRNEFVTKLFHRREEPEPQVFLGNATQKLVDPWLVVRPDRTNYDSPIVLKLVVPHPLRRIRPNREIGIARPGKFPHRRPYGDTGIDRKNAGLIGK